jgi:hypothetical protein
MLDPVTSKYQSEIDKDYIRLLKELRRVYLEHAGAQADYTHFKNMLDKSILISEKDRLEAKEKMQFSYAKFKKMDEEFRLLKKQIEKWSVDCLKLQESMPNLKVYTFETLYSNLFNKSEIV